MLAPVGGEVSLPGMTYSGTTFRNGDQTQTTNVITLGTLLGSMSYENDTEMPYDWIPGVPAYDGGDRYRTAAFRIRVGVAETDVVAYRRSGTQLLLLVARRPWLLYGG
jgi:hypothetical protein